MPLFIVRALDLDILKVHYTVRSVLGRAFEQEGFIATIAVTADQVDSLKFDNNIFEYEAPSPMHICEDGK
jgi:hypothetical protein